MIKDFKKYFKDIGLYSGAIDNNIDELFIFAAKSIENKLSLLTKTSFKGMIWNGKSICSSPDDLKKAFAQATMDAIDPKDDVPSAIKFVLTEDETKTEPSEPQQIGLTEQLLPEKLSQDDRFLMFSKINR